MGLLNDIKLWAAAKRYGPARETLAYPKLIGLLGRGNAIAQQKPSPSNLRYFPGPLTRVAPSMPSKIRWPGWNGRYGPKQNLQNPNRRKRMPGHCKRAWKSPTTTTVCAACSSRSWRMR